MTSICPTVTAFDTKTFMSQFKLVQKFADRIHIDLMDGHFAPSVSPQLTDLKIQSKKILDIHMMYSNPDEYIDVLIALEPNLVIIHPESNADVPFFATNLRECGIKTGLAILPETSIESVALLLPHVQHVLIFGGHLGYHGGEADLAQLAKVAEVRKYSHFLEIGWDGGANLDNAQQIKQAGVDVINVGKAIHSSPDPQTRYKDIVQLVA